MYLQNEIHHKKQDRIVKTVCLSKAEIHLMFKVASELLIEGAFEIYNISRASARRYFILGSVTLRQNYEQHLLLVTNDFHNTER